MKGYSKLEQIFIQYGIKLTDEDGESRNLYDVLEDMYLKLNGTDMNRLFFEISESEIESNVFDDARGWGYGEY